MARAYGPAAAPGFSSLLRGGVLAVAGVAAAVGYVESCPRVEPGLLDDAVCALQQEATVSLQQRFADRLGAGRGSLAKHAGSALLADGALASSAMEAAQEARARRASAKQEQDEQLLEASASGTSGSASSAAVAASADASKAAAVAAAASARRGETSGVRMPAVTRYDRRRQQPLPKLLDRTLEAMPRLGSSDAASPSHVLSLFSAGAVAAMKSVAPSLFEGEETNAHAPAANASAKEAARRDPVAEGADMETRASPGAMQLASRGKRAVTAGKKEKAYYTVESADEKLGKKVDGLAYRLTKSLGDKDVTMKPLAWGSIVHGLDEGDGWLKVDGGYLPFAVSGSPVLTLKSAPSAIDIVAASEAATTTCPFSHKDGILEYLSCLADRCEDWDPAVLQGVTCEETFLPLGCDSDLGDALREDPSGTAQPVAAPAQSGIMISAACPALCGLCTEPAPKKLKPKPADQHSPANQTLAAWVADHNSAAALLQEGTARTASAAGQSAGQAKARAAAGVALYVPSVRAQSVEFDDRDERPGFVKGPVRIRRALDEASVDHYTLWWAARGKRLSAQSAIKLLRKTGEDLQFDLPRTKVPEGAEGLMVVTGNQKGDMRVGPVALFSVQEGPSFSEIFGGFLRGG